MNIVYLIAGTYRPAGMERVLANKANWLSANGHKVTIVTTDQRGRKPAFRMSGSIDQIDLKVNYENDNGKSFLHKILHYPVRRLRHRRKLARLLKRIRPDITVSMFCNDAAFLPRIHDGSRKVLEVHFCRFKRLQYGRSGIWGLSDKALSRKDERTARKFDRFVVLTNEDAENWNVPGLRVIPNFPTFNFDEPAPLDGKTVLAVGRYSPQKHFTDLLRAWDMIRADARKGWTLRIVGDGQERDRLSDFIDMHRLRNVILGPDHHMDDVYASASVLALTSRYEGLPMVLLEAQSAGLPIVSYDCKCGPRDVVTDGVDGFLVPEGEPDMLAAKLEKLMTDDELRHRMGAESYRSSARYRKDYVMAAWMELFEELCNK